MVGSWYLTEKLMNRERSGLRPILLPLLAIALAFAPDDASAQAVRHVVEILVVRGDSSRVEGAQVVIPKLNTGIMTHADGIARFDDVPTGMHEVRVRRIGYLQQLLTVRVDDEPIIRRTVVLNEARLDIGSSPEDVRKVDEALAHVGRKDSIALRLVLPDTTNRIGWQSLGRRVLQEAMQRTRAHSNIVFSPASAGFAFSMVLAGAGGKTSSELASALAVDGLSSREVGRRSALYLASIKQRNDVTLEVANAAWWNPRSEPTATYRDRIAADYGARIERRELSSKDFVNALNKWAREATHGMIPEVLKKPLPDTTVFLLANATYFHGSWLLPFDVQRTKSRPFFVRGMEAARVPMMEIVTNASYIARDGFRVARLPYSGGKAAMYVVLPDSGRALDPTALPFIGTALADSLLDAPRPQLHIVLPRLTLTHEEPLVPTMQALGVHDLFDCDRADLRAMIVDSMPLCVGVAKQDAVVEVAEEGTKAAAVTIIGGITVTSAPPPPIEFVVNRPFYFVVRDEVRGVDLFVGYVVDPRGR